MTKINLQTAVKDGIVYNIICQKCQSIYIGESSRNAISRGKEHKQDFDTNKETSIMLRHIKTHHQHDTNKPEFKMIVTHIYNNNSMDRQISEAIQINNIPKQQIINTKIEIPPRKTSPDKNSPGYDRQTQRRSHHS